MADDVTVAAGDGDDSVFTFAILDNGNPDTGILPTVRVHGKVKQVCTWSLFVFSIHSRFRQKVILLVEWWWFDKFILFLIFLNSIMLANIRYREDDDVGYNFVFNRIADPIFTGCFSVELLLKVIALGVVVDRRSYLRDAWNCLDLVVVVSSLISFVPGVSNNSNNLEVLRIFRVLKPLRSLSALSQIKVLVRTMINCIPNLGSVALMALFLYTLFGIVGVMVFDGVFFRRCRTLAEPELAVGGAGERCWSWPYAEGETRYCGGRYMCEGSGGFCGGHEFDFNEDFRPRFPSGERLEKWCEGSAPAKLHIGSKYVHFDHILGALLAIFQCMTLEGWTEIMYDLLDASALQWAVVAYFLVLIPVISFFLLNISTAAIDSVFADELSRKEQRDDQLTHLLDDAAGEWRRRCGHRCCHRRQSGGTLVTVGATADAEITDEDLDKEPGIWLDVAIVRLAHRVAFSRCFTTLFLFLIVANIVIMTFERFPPEVFWLDFLEASNTTFLWAFTVEMAVMLLAMGPWKYCTSLLSLFDGIIVLISWLEVFLEASSVFRVLRALRIVLKLNKFARNWARLDSMLKAMWATTLALKNWLVLFLLALYMSTLLGMSFFANLFHFNADGTAIAPGAHWCPGTDGEILSRRQDCIPRAHFDTFLWAFVTVFQIMTGENWNTVMYDGMNAGGGAFVIYFVWLIVFGQVLVLSLFLSVLMSQFMEARVKIEELRSQTKRTTKLFASLTQHLFRVRTKSKTAFRMGRQRARAGTTAWEGPSSSTEATTEVSKITVRPRSSEGVSTKKGLDEVSLTQVLPSVAKFQSTKSLSGFSGKHKAGLRMTPRSGDPVPDSELIGSTFLEELGAGKSTQADDASQDAGASGSSSSIDTAPATPPLVRVWEDEDREPPGRGRQCLSSSCRRRHQQLRECACWLLGLKVRIRGKQFQIIEGIVFVCIMLSTVVTFIDNPLSNPEKVVIRVVRAADAVFSVIFTVEILTKLLALGTREFFWGPERSWNRLDTLVVVTSCLGLLRVVRGGGFKIIRIVRAIRPLRIISRAPTLRIVVQTVLSSLPGLMTLILCSLACMLVFALIGVSIISGRLYHCDNADGRPLALTLDVGSNFTTPLCLRPSFDDFTEQWTAGDVTCPNGGFQRSAKEWLPGPGCPTGACGSALSLAWHRASPDTPICVGRCDPYEPPHVQPLERQRLCPRRFESLEELPSACPAGVPRAVPEVLLDREAVGQRYVRAMQREFVLPCAGSAATGAGPLARPAAGVSCRATFCPGELEEGRVEGCRAECARHPHFCRSVCSSDGSSDACLSCREECEAACQCREFCEPLILDAALCREQGLQWLQRLSQNFDNFGAAMLSLFEISTTEGWVDLMYAAADVTSVYMEPVRDAEEGIAACLFCCYIFLTNIFLLNLSVGLIVDNFIGLKEEMGGRRGLLLTDAQQKWVNSRKALLARKQLFSLWNLQLLPKCRRRVYDLVSSQAFELFIMIVVLLNILCLALKVFPSHMEHWPPFFHLYWNHILEVGNIIGGCIFLLEFLLKLFALRMQYWADGLNVFDFLCLVVTGVTTVADSQQRRGGGAMLGNAMRIARCVRLVGFFQELKRLFRALILTLPKLANVMLTFLLLLIMYGILGVNLFSTAKHSEEHAANGHFRDFFWAFLTLFRATTGEAWNEIMHDLATSESDRLRAGSWCTPTDMFDASSSHSWSLLQSKCLIDNPNACPMSGIFDPMTVPALFWVSFTMIITFLFMNLLLAVIIDSYQDCRENPNAVVLDLCFKRWKKHDLDHEGLVPLPQVMVFIHEVLLEFFGAPLELPSKGLAIRSASLSALAAIPMKVAQSFCLRILPDGRVHYLSAFQQVLRFMAAEGNTNLSSELDAVEAIIGRREAERLRRTEEKRLKSHNIFSIGAVELRVMIAIVKLQRSIRKRAQQRRCLPKSPEGELEAREEAADSGQDELQDVEAVRLSQVPDIRANRRHHLAVPASNAWLGSEASSQAATERRVVCRDKSHTIEDVDDDSVARWDAVAEE